MADYLEQELVFYADRIEVKQTGVQVMMSWERPLMRRMAEIVAMRRGDVLEIGFGMGISCDEVQRLGPRTHTIVEAHPQIIERARSWAADKPNVTLVPGRWQDVLEVLGTYDGIAFDIFGGNNQRLEFFAHIERLLRPHGVATLWLGDDQDLSPEMQALLARQGLTYRLSRVTAVPDRRCTYSRANSFCLPLITRPGTG